MEGTPRSGTILVGKYRVESVLGREGICIALRVAHLRIAGEPVFKMLLPDASASLAMHARFLKEAQSTAHLRGEHVARVIDVGLFPNGAPYLIMEHLHSGDLQTELARRGALSPAEAVDTALQCCDALAEAHARSILHRDIKPSNLGLILRPDGPAMVKLLDLGISKTFAAVEGPLGRTDSVIGTPGYMPPEQYRPSEELDARCDVWALGAVIYECLSGQRAYPSASERSLPGGPPRPLDFRIPEALQATVMRCLTIDRDARFPTMAAVAASLAPFSHDPHIAAVVVERARLWSQGIDPGLEAPPQYAAAAAARPVGPISAWSRSRRRVATIGAVALAVSIGGIATAALVGDGRTRDPQVLGEESKLTTASLTVPATGAAPSPVTPVAATAPSTATGSPNAATGSPNAATATGSPNAATATGSPNAATRTPNAATGPAAAPAAGPPGAGTGTQDPPSGAVVTRNVHAPAEDTASASPASESTASASPASASPASENTARAPAAAPPAPAADRAPRRITRSADAEDDKADDVRIVDDATERSDRAERSDKVARAPATPPAPISKQRKEACDDVEIGDLMTRAATQYAAGAPTAALSLTRIALGCKQTERMYWLAVLYACAARDVGNARLYFSKVPSNLQPGIEQKCQQSNLDVRSR